MKTKRDIFLEDICMLVFLKQKEKAYRDEIKELIFNLGECIFTKNMYIRLSLFFNPSRIKENIDLFQEKWADKTEELWNSSR